MKTLALVGGRGFTGSELLTLLARHPQLELALASSGSQAGTPLQAACPAWPILVKPIVCVLTMYTAYNASNNDRTA